VSATATRDRLIVKLVNTNSHTIQARLNLEGISDGKAKVEYLQSDDLNAANAMKFNGTPEYRIELKTMEITIQDCAAVLDLKPHGFYVLVINR
jgi:alpha-L-arabinofuranosidase